MRPSRRSAALVAALAGAALGWSAPRCAAAADAEHWLVPSTRSVNSGTLRDGGVPPATASPAAISRSELQREGAVLYATHCATCHGADFRGSRGVPSLEDAGGAATDFYMTTGRMPLAVRASSADAGPPTGRTEADGVQVDHVAPLFDARQTAALDAYVDAHVAHVVPIPNVVLDPALLQRGRRLFEDNCQMCHGAGAQGATAGYQWTALPLDLASPTQIGEAIRVGPGVMPRFTPEQLSDRDIAAVATYVRYLVTQPQTYGGLTLGYIGPAAEGAIGAFGGVGLLFWVVYFTGTKADGRRVNELDPRDDA